MGGSKNRRHDPLGSETEPLRPPQTAKEVKDLLAEATAGVHAGRLEPRMGSVMEYLGTALLKAIETTDYQERIRVFSAWSCIFRDVKPSKSPILSKATEDIGKEDRR